MKTDLIALLIFCALLVPAVTTSQVDQVSQTPAAERNWNNSPAKLPDADAGDWLKNDPSGFEENRGQFRDQEGRPNTMVKYLLNMPGLKVQLRSTGFSYDTWIDKSSGRTFHRVDIELLGSDPHAKIIADQVNKNISNVISEQNSFAGIRSYGRVTYRNIYPGIDLEFVAKKGTNKPVEYNFIVHPGADPSQIKMQYNGQNDIGLKKGKIEMLLNHGKLSEHIPASWVAESGRQVAVRYIAKEKNIYAFHVPHHSRKETLIIDPTPNLEWSTYFGGSSVDQIAGVATDNEGNIYVTGFTSSGTNIASAGAYDGTYGGGVTGTVANEDVFVAKFTTNGQRVWATYYGAAGRDSATAIAVKGNVVYVGGTASSAGMATAGAHQTTQTAANNPTGFLAKFDITTGQRTWGTYYGGSIRFMPTSIAVDDQDNFYVYGGFKTFTQTPTGVNITTAGTFRPTLPSVYTNQYNSALVKFNAAGVRQWGTYIDFSSVAASSISYLGGVALDAEGQPYVCGSTTSTDLAANASQGQTMAAGGDVYILRMNKDNGQRTWGRYFGGPSGDYIMDIHIDKAGQTIYTTGMTKSASGISTPGTFIDNVPIGLQTSGSLVRGGYLASFDLNGVQKMGTYLNTYIGTQTNAQTYGASVTQDNSGKLYVVALSNEPTATLATNCTYRNTYAGTGYDLVVSHFSPEGQRLWGTYLGSPGNEFIFSMGGIADSRGKSIDTDPAGNIILGYNSSAAGAATAGAFQSEYGGGGFDGVIAKLNQGQVPSNVAVTGSSLSPSTQTTCILGIPNVITGNAVSLFNPPSFTSPIFYQWQVADAASGPWTDLPGEVFKDLQPVASQTTKYYRRMILVNNGFCDKKLIDSSGPAEVLVNSNVSPVANANGPQWYVCGAGANTVALNGSATGGSGVYTSYQWYAGSDFSSPVSSAANYSATATAATTYTLKVTDNAGCVDVDQVTVTPVTANAGPDVSFCENSGGVQIGTPGIPGGAVSYAWTTVSGSAVATSLSCTNCAQPIASPTVNSTYRLTVTVTRKGGATCTTVDDVVVNVVAAPAGGASFGGSDQTICKGNPVMLGGSNDAAATYQWAPTSYLSASNIYNPTFNAGTNKTECPMVYTVTATKNGCTFTDQVSVTVVDPSTSLDAQTVACQGWSSGNTNNCSGATYSWQLVSGPGVVPSGSRLRNGGADAYLTNTGAVNAVYRRVTTINGVNCNSADITISPCVSSGGNPAGCPPVSIAMITPQGCPKVFGEQELKLFVSGVNAADYDFSWSPANIIDNPSAPIITITSTEAATVNVTITNKYTGLVCSAPPMPINNPSWSLPVLNLTDKSTCPASPVSIGEPAAAGFSYLWSPATGLSSSTDANPVASLSSSGTFTLTKTDIGSGCKTTGAVNVMVQAIDFDAGVDRTICNGAVATLGTVPGGSYTYSWTPANAAWTGGTGPTDANPKVLFASTTQTFNVTVTDPLTGCQKTDAVTLRGTVLPGEYAGTAPGAPYCPGETVQLGREAEINASYSWSPATGLSCTDCANPVLTVGALSQAYSVEVSYPGCTTPVTDNVTVDVTTLPNVVLTNKTICPTSPTNIGIGGTGNTASLANVSKYEWSPATGLSCTNCASPNANPVAVTTYKVVITFNSGCKLEREVTVTPVVTATAKPDATICPGGSVVLGSPSTTNVTYSWTILSGTAGSINPTNVAQPTANPTVTSVYRLTATGTGSKAGCTVTDDVQITVKNLPALDITGNTSVCEGGTINLAVSSVTPNMTYQWSPLAGVSSPDSSNTRIMPGATTTYRVTQTDINSGCSNYKELVVTVWPNNVSATGGKLVVCPASSATMPLTVSPATGNIISWSPTLGLNNAYIQSPTISPQTGGSYIATVTNSSTSCSDTALVIVTVPSSCLGSDYGDAPQVYERGVPASHGISEMLKIGASVDSEGAAASAVMNALATGDDFNGQVNDEEGISFLPAPTTASKSVGLVINNVLNNTGKTAYMVAWIDFNRDGDFSDAGERSQIVTLPSSSAAADPVVQFTGFNTGCIVQAGPSYLRVRLTTDDSEDWDVNPSPVGARADGEVEDYSILINGTDFGDAPAIYAVAKAIVNPDLNADGMPDEAGSVWLGNIVDYQSCGYIASMMARADDEDGTADEDGLNMNGDIVAGASKIWNLTVNSEGPVNNVQWGMWIDWNADGVFDQFHRGSVNTASPTIVPVPVTAAMDKSPNYIVRVGAKTGSEFTAADYNYPVSNGEWEDYIGPNAVLSVTLVSFDAFKVDRSAVLKWETASEDNCDYFAIERSSDEANWEEIGRTKAAGFSNKKLTYSMVDQKPLPATNLYRLKIADMDGKFKYSKIKRLDFGESGNLITIYPNPARFVANLVFSKAPKENFSVQILSNHGQVVRSFDLKSSGLSYKLYVPDLANGLYHVKIVGNGINEQLKLIIR